MNLSARTDDQLDNLIRNHEAKGAARAELCLAAREERNARRGFDFEASLALLRAAAAEKRCVTFADFGRDSGVKRTNVRREVGAHLHDFAAWAAARDLPMLTALVVDRTDLASGRMSGDALKAFLAEARALGHEVPEDEAGFVEAERARVFAWAAEAPVA